jgi:tetratricopeptide (TPR) repeat protein
MAFSRNDYEAALRLAEKARDEAPWLYEAVQLEAEIHLTRGVERKDRGESEDAARDLEAAGRLFDTAADAGRSDAALYEGGAEARVRRMELSVTAGGPPGDDYAAAVDRCAKAAAARPDRSEPYTELAYAHHFNWMYASRGSGTEARAVLAKGLAAAQRALEIGGGDFATYERLAGAQQSAALYEIDHGLDPHASIDDAIANAQRAIKASPSHPWGHTALAIGHYYRGLFELKSGDDPTTDLRITIDECRAATELDRSYVIGYSNILEANVHLARWYAERGEDPAPMTVGANVAFSECTRANPRFADCFENAGGVDAWLGAYRVEAGLDAREALGRARENLDKASALANNLENRQRSANVLLLLAQDARRRGDDPKSALATLGEMLTDCYRLGATDSVCTLLDARRELFAAEREAQPLEGAHLLRARALALLAVSRANRDAETYEALAEAEQRLAAMPGPSAEQKKHRVAGLEACASALALNPSYPRLHLIRGRLLLQDAHAAATKDRRGPAQAARDALKRSFALNPLLRGEAAPALADAEQLAGTS